MPDNREIHLVSFNIPYPPNYGGVIDVFYKIKTLHELGIEINLHCFKYDRPESEELDKYCKTVNYYHRPKTIYYYLSRIPFIVYTRSSKALLDNLSKDSLPVIFEGLHSTYFLRDLLLKSNRQIIVRTHNIEHEYYRHLAKKEKNIFKKLFFSSEATKLESYEQILESNIKIAAITEKDSNYFKSLINSTCYIPAFHPFNEININTSIGKYILYHGDLSVNENIEAAYFIINNISSQIDFPFKIAGRNPDKKVLKLIKKHDNIEIITNPSNDDLNELIKNAQINLLITFQDTGIKLKLINTLHIGKHCIANNKMVNNTGLESLCQIKNSPREIIKEIKNLIDKPFTESEINKRKQILLKIVNNTHNAQKLINLLD